MSNPDLQVCKAWMGNAANLDSQVLMEEKERRDSPALMATAPRVKKDPEVFLAPLDHQVD